MTNIVMLVHDRLRLTAQALQSLREHTDKAQYTLTLVDDQSTDFRVRKLLEKECAHDNTTLVRIEKSQHVLARAKNLGVYWSEQTFGRGDWLYLSDNDVWFSPGWLTELKTAARMCEPFLYLLLGGQVHPFHQTEGDGRLRALQVLDGPSWLMRWTDWDKYGPLDRECAPGVCQSEEYPFCERIRADGKRIGVIYPHVVVHTGLTNSDGKPAPGAEERRKMIPAGVLAE